MFYLPVFHKNIWRLKCTELRSATQIFPKFERRAGIGFSADLWRLVVNQCATWLRAECTHILIYVFVSFCDFFLDCGCEGAVCFASNLARMWRKLTKYLNSHLMNWVRRKRTTSLSSLKNRRRSADNDQRSGWPGKTPENAAEVREVIREDRRRTIQDVYSIVGLL